MSVTEFERQYEHSLFYLQFYKEEYYISLKSYIPFSTVFSAKHCKFSMKSTVPNRLCKYSITFYITEESGDK